jgi:hypothetical protein
MLTNLVEKTERPSCRPLWRLGWRTLATAATRPPLLLLPRRRRRSPPELRAALGWRRQGLSPWWWLARAGSGRGRRPWWRRAGGLVEAATRGLWRHGGSVEGRSGCVGVVAASAGVVVAGGGRCGLVAGDGSGGVPGAGCPVPCCRLRRVVPSMVQVVVGGSVLRRRGLRQGGQRRGGDGSLRGGGPRSPPCLD